MRELSLFTGAGGGLLGGILLGWTCVCAVEIDPYCQGVLRARQRDGALPPFPIHGDIKDFDGTPWRGKVDVISGGFPCQDISSAGRGAGIDGERSGLWSEYARIVREVRPVHVFVENSPMLTTRGLGRVLGDLAAMGFDAEWCVLGADDVGAPHIRKRIWIRATHPDREVADDTSHRRRPGRARGSDPSNPGELEQAFRDPDSERKLQPQRGVAEQRGRTGDASWWTTEPDVGRVAYGVASGVDRLRVLGNGQVPSVAALAWETLR